MVNLGLTLALLRRAPIR